MRKIILVVASGAVLGGCLGSGDGASETTQNSRPVISGDPNQAVMVNNMYDFEPVAQDADGDTLTFEIENKPDWASFSTATGRLSGQPTTGDLGTYSNIVLSVSDGQATASLQAFSVTVTDSANGSVTLSWQAPTENADGSPLTNLAGYKIFYGVTSGQYNNEVVINNAGTTTHVVDNLLPDTYYFAAKSFNTSGIESEFSGEAVKLVN